MLNDTEGYDSKEIRSRSGSVLHNSHVMAEAGIDSGREIPARRERRLLGDTGERPTDGTPQARQAESKRHAKIEEKAEQIDPLTLPYVMMSELDYLPTCSGVYFAIEEVEQVAYVGQSCNIRQRWRAHHVEGDLCDLSDLHSARRVKIAWFETAGGEDISTLERLLILRFRPRLNKTHLQPLKPVRAPKPAREPQERIAGNMMVGMKKPGEVKRLTVKEAAEILGAGESSGRAWCVQGKFPNATATETPRGPIWYIPESDLDGFEKRERGRPPKPAEQSANGQAAKPAARKKSSNGRKAK